MSRLVLHVGRSKTGSTLIQQCLALNRSRLAAEGITVPDIFASANHAELALAFSATPGQLARAQALDGEGDRLRLRQRLDRKLAAAVRPGSVWVMTSEHLSSRLREPTEIDGLRLLLARHFEHVDVLAYLRRPDHLAPSLYAEAVKAGRKGRLNAAFVAQRQRSFDHASFQQLWRTAFASVTVRPYLETFKSRPQALAIDFLDTVARISGLRPLTPDGWTWPDRGVNPSLSAEGTEFLRLVNPHVPAGPLTQQQRRTLVTEVRARCPGSSVLLTAAALKALRVGDLLTGGLEAGAFEGDPAWAAWFAAPSAGRPDG